MDTKNRCFINRVIPSIGATVVVLADDFAIFLAELSSVNSIKVIFVDNTYRNTNCEGGLLTAPKKNLKRKLHTTGLNFHLTLLLSTFMELQEYLHLLLVL